MLAIVFSSAFPGQGRNFGFSQSRFAFHGFAKRLQAIVSAQIRTEKRPPLFLDLL